VEAQHSAHRERKDIALSEVERPNSPVIPKGKAALVNSVVSAGLARYSVKVVV
jgi:hypothetical protein